MSGYRKEKRHHRPMGGLIGPLSTWQEKLLKQQQRKEETSRNDSLLMSTLLDSWLETRLQGSGSAESAIKYRQIFSLSTKLCNWKRDASKLQNALPGERRALL